MVVVCKTGEREAHRVRWGLVPGYAKSLKAGPPMFNARAETIAVKRPFKDLLAKPRGRCLILADGFYDKLDKLQGKMNTFYASGLNGYETVEFALRAGRDVVEHYMKWWAAPRLHES